MLLFSDVLYMLVRYASPSGPMCLSCLMLTLSGPVEFLLCFIVAWTCVVVNVMLVVCSLSVFLSMCLFVECVCYLFGWGECFLFESYWVVFFCSWLIHVLSSKEYVCCDCDPSVCLGVPSIC